MSHWLRFQRRPNSSPWASAHALPFLLPLGVAAVALWLLLAGAPAVQAQDATVWPPRTQADTLYLPLVAAPSPPPATGYAVLGWNDLGMHCYNADFSDLAVLPPYNTLWTQIVRRGAPPVIVTAGLTATYHFTDNTYSVGKSNFWTYAPQLFGANLPDNIGLTGRGLAGTFDRNADHFAAHGIPLTEFSDSAPTTPDPYQLALIRLLGPQGELLASNTVVAPVSTEMHCDNCHFDGGIEDIATGKVETNILTLHDEENAEEYPPGHQGLLMNRRPVLCAECHASNALGAPGVAGVPNLSNAIHRKHRNEIPQTTEGCYNCHPGPVTQCLRDVMSSQHGMDCIDCHGTMTQVLRTRTPGSTNRAATPAIRTRPTPRTTRSIATPRGTAASTAPAATTAPTPSPPASSRATGSSSSTCKGIRGRWTPAPSVISPRRPAGDRTVRRDG